MTSKPQTNFKCRSCPQSFTRNSNLKRHILKLHPTNESCATKATEYSSSPHNINCGLCSTYFPSCLALCNHVEESHERSATVKTLDFISIKDFMAWKIDVETNGKFRFRIRCRKQLKHYYYCYRSGKKTIKDDHGRVSAYIISILKCMIIIIVSHNILLAYYVKLLPLSKGD